MSVSKRSVIVLFLFALCIISSCAACVHTDVAYADGEIIDDGPVTPIGFDLADGKQALVEYRRYTLPISGVYFEFDVTFDDEFFREIGEVRDSVFYPSSILEDLADKFASAGYDVATDPLGKVVAKRKYDSLTDYYIAIGIDGFETNENNATKDSGVYFTTYTTTTQTPFCSVDTEGSFLNGIYSMLVGAGVTREGISLKYHYGTPYKIISSDADVKEYDKTNGVYVHTFVMDCDTAGREITLVQKSPNTVGWYATAVIIALPIIVVPLVITILKKKKNKGEQNA